MFERILVIILPVLIIVLAGWLYARKVKPDMRAANKLNMDVCVPLLVFTALSAKDFQLATQWKLIPAATLVVLISGLLAWPVARLSGISPRTLLPPVMFNNCGNMGLPLALLAFGRDGFNAFVMLFVISNLLHFTLGAMIFSSRTSLRGLSKNPIVIATALGLLFGLANWHLPDWLMTGLKMLGDMTIPLMLFALGVRMTDTSLKGWHIGVLGAILCPLTGIAAAWLIAPWLQLSSGQYALLMLFGALPPAVLNFLMAELYQQEPERIASMVLIGNLASLLFIPLGLALAL